MARRAAKEGTVFQNANGRWTAMLELPRRADGKRHRKLRRARTQAEAQRLLREMQDEVQRTGSVASAQRTLPESIEAYRRTRRDSDHDEWASSLVVEGLGAMRLGNLTVTHCDEFLEAAALGIGNRRSVGREQITKLRQFLVAVLRNEMRTGNLGRNVAELSELPVIEEARRERRALSRSELRGFLAEAEGSRLIIADFCGRNGLRPAEARAVQWDAVDLDRAEMTVGPQRDRSNEPTGPKTPKAPRTITIDNVTIGRLKSWRDEQAELRARAGSAWRDEGIVASTARGTAVDRHSLARSVRLICRNVGIVPKVTPYELRHTAISMQADVGRSSWEIADWAGTSEAMINRVYRHRLRRVAKLMPVDELPDAEHLGSDG